MSLRPELIQHILTNPVINGVYHLPAALIGPVRDAAAASGLIYYTCDLGKAADGQAALKRLAQELEFPEWFGNNFDALHDCLTDLTWQETSSTVIMISGADVFSAKDPEAWEKLLEVFSSVADYWHEDETPFWVFFDTHAEDLSHLPSVG